MWIIFVNLILAVVPSLLLLLFFYKKDKLKKEPPKLIWRTFAFGLIAVVPAIIIELLGGLLLGDALGIGAIFIDAFIITALVEEYAKYMTVRISVWKRPEFDEVTDGIVYTIAASLGFAMLENLFYSFGSTFIVILRGVTAVPLHAIASGVMGYYLGLAKIQHRNTIVPGLLFAVLIHGVYDFLLFTETALGLLIIPLLIGSWFILRGLHKRAQLFDSDAKREKPWDRERWNFTDSDEGPEVETGDTLQ